MGWRDAPEVQASAAPKWASAPEVGAPSAPAAPEESLPSKIGHALVGAGETAASLGSQALAYPAGLAAAFGKYMSPWSRPSLLGPKGLDVQPPQVTDDKGQPVSLESLPPEMRAAVERQYRDQRARNDNSEAWRAAGQERKAVENLLTYSPRTEAGKQELSAVQGALANTVGKPLGWLGEKGGNLGAKIAAATGADPEQQGQIRDVASEATQVGAGALAPELLRVARPPPGSVSGGLRSYAEKAAVKAANADRTATKRVFGRPLNQAARSEVGGYLLDEGIPLRSPAAMQDALAEKMATEGPQIKSVVTQASNAGAKVDLGAVKTKVLADPDIQALKSNTETRPIYGRVEAFLDDQIAQHGAGMDPVAAHALRSKTLDNLAAWDRTASKVDQTAAGAYRTVRGVLSDELGKTIDAAGLGDEWAAANAGYKNAARAKELADVGAERRTGNRIGSPSEKAAGLFGGAALALHNPVAGVAIPAATVALNRGFFPASAHTANALSRLLQSAPASVVGQAVATPARLSPLLAALQRIQGGESAPWLRLNPAVAGEEGQ
jgi:hypothetical protein